MKSTLTFLFGATVTVLTIGVMSSACAARVLTVMPPDEGGTGNGLGNIGTSLGDGGSTSRDGSTIPKRDSGTTTDPDPDPSGTCPTTAPIAASSLAWKPPAKSIGACTTTDLNNLVNALDTNPSATTAQMEASVTGTTCRSCIFGTDTGSTWAPLVKDATGELAIINVGGCIAIATNSTACGKAYQNFFDCTGAACADCADTSSYQSCRTKALSGACKNIVDAVVPACGSDQIVADAETACENTTYVFEASIKAQCIGGI